MICANNRAGHYACVGARSAGGLDTMAAVLGFFGLISRGWFTQHPVGQLALAAQWRTDEFKRANRRVLLSFRDLIRVGDISESPNPDAGLTIVTRAPRLT